MDNQTYKSTYGDLLPDCPCFQQQEGEADIPLAGQNYMGMASTIGDQITALLLAGNLCPVAMPAVLSTIVSSVVLGMLSHRTAAQSPAEMIPEVRDMFERVIAHLPRELERVNRGAAMFGVQGSC